MTHVKLFYFLYEYEQFTASESIFIFVYFMLLAASRRPPLATHVTPHVISDRAAPIDKDGGCYMSQLLLLGKFEYGGGPIFKVVLEC